MTEVYLVRHAQTTGNNQKIFQGRLDADLSREGDEQLDFLAERFCSIALDGIYTSPLLRTRKTAAAIGKHHNVPIVPDDMLIEISVGDFEGKTFTELFDDFEGEMDNFLTHPWDFAPPNGEKMTEVYDRICSAMSRIVAENSGKSIAVVTHGGTIRNYLSHLLHGDIYGMDKVPVCFNTGVTHIRFTDSGKAFVVYINDASHLPAELLEHGKWELKR